MPGCTRDERRILNRELHPDKKVQQVKVRGSVDTLCVIGISRFEMLLFVSFWKQAIIHIVLFLSVIKELNLVHLS